jgi:Na+-driven multidrug efflux pump
VAIPTLVSRMTAAVLILLYLKKGTWSIRLEHIDGFRFDGRMIKRILTIGIPNGLENSMFQLGKIMVLSLVSTFGTSAIAANAVSNSLAMFQNLAGMSINLAVTTVIARCVGAGDYEQAEYYTKKLLKIIYIANLIANAVIFVLMPFFLNAYHLTDQTAQTARHILYFHAVSVMLIWPMAFSLPCTLRAAGDAKWPMIISITSMWMFRIVFSYLLGKYCHMGVFGVWVAMVIDWCVRALLMGWRYRKGRWKEIHLIG